MVSILIPINLIVNNVIINVKNVQDQPLVINAKIPKQFYLIVILVMLDIL